MTEQEIKLREQQMRKEHPEKFKHPELRPDEIWYCSKLIDCIGYDLDVYHQNGAPSARTGKAFMHRPKPSEPEFPYCPVFMKVRELILAEEKRQQKVKAEGGRS
ncbi:MAG TPA: hypothetical protein VLK33_14865 [Terriglobales bacterium]|nr:hypothetical protein [Terriglobales bacterium]